MVQHNSYKHSNPPTISFAQGQRSRSKIPNNSCSHDNLKNNYWVSSFFYAELPMSMEMTIVQAGDSCAMRSRVDQPIDMYNIQSMI